MAHAPLANGQAWHKCADTLRSIRVYTTTPKQTVGHLSYVAEAIRTGVMLVQKGGEEGLSEP